MGKKVCLLVVDPQYDFCATDGKLSVAGADKDMERLAKMVSRAKDDIEEIIVTLDSHRTLHIAHPIWWKDKDGNHPDPYTLINEEDVVGDDPKWKTTNPGYQARSVEYVKSL
jgi:nicotinamidase/pyrazinamidase